MKNKNIWLVWSIALITATSTVYAVPIIIDFEDLSHNQVVGSHYTGLTFSGATCLQKPQYNWEHYPPHSGVNVVYTLATPIRVDFDSEVSMTGAWVMGGSLQTTVYLEAYDASDNLLDSTSVKPPYKGEAYVEVKASNIKYVIFHDSARYWVMDDLTYEYMSCPAPEFGSLAMVVAILLTTPAFAYLVVRRHK